MCKGKYFYRNEATRKCSSDNIGQMPVAAIPGKAKLMKLQPTGDWSRNWESKPN